MRSPRLARGGGRWGEGVVPGADLAPGRGKPGSERNRAGASGGHFALHSAPAPDAGRACARRPAHSSGRRAYSMGRWCTCPITPPASATGSAAMRPALTTSTARSRACCCAAFGVGRPCPQCHPSSATAARIVAPKPKTGVVTPVGSIPRRRATCRSVTPRYSCTPPTPPRGGAARRGRPPRRGLTPPGRDGMMPPREGPPGCKGVYC